MKTTTVYKKIKNISGISPKRDLKLILKIMAFLMLFFIVFVLIQTPARLWLPFANDFPSWLVDVPLLLYLPQILLSLGVLISIAVVIWFFFKLGKILDKYD